jgi:uncharacterized protein RhaS with RHS repeats
MFDPSVGRWLEEDPIQFQAGDANLYRDVRNNLTDAEDPSGFQAKTMSLRMIDSSPLLEKVFRGDLGYFAWPIMWEINNPNNVRTRGAGPKGGTIIQWVSVEFKIEKAERVDEQLKVQDVPNYKHPADTGDWNYYEAWSVLPNSRTGRERQGFPPQLVGAQVALANALIGAQQEARQIQANPKIRWCLTGVAHSDGITTLSESKYDP